MNVSLTTKRNWPLLCAAGGCFTAIVVYVAVYLLAMPRYCIGVRIEDTTRFCFSEWQRQVWYPLSRIEAAWRKKETFLFLCRDQKTVDRAVEKYHLQRVWP